MVHADGPVLGAELGIPLTAHVDRHLEPVAVPRDVDELRVERLGLRPADVVGVRPRRDDGREFDERGR
ncbi:hypothetical protein F6J84_01330 [Microbacterium caowuchunii]|nr:hypothetical protein F6J84_01330 [Microbacterium caowuchunii]